MSRQSPPAECPSASTSAQASKDMTTAAGRFAALLLALVTLGVGCSSSSTSSSSVLPVDRPVTIRVVDAETAQPLPSATATLDYGKSPSPLGRTITRYADADARIVVFTAGATKGAGASPEWRIEAPGYIAYWVQSRR